MQIAVAALPVELAEALLSLAVFPSDTQIPVTAIMCYWAHTRDRSAEQTAGDLKALAAANVLGVDGDAVGFHDLQHNYLLLHAPRLALLHAGLLDAYRVLLPAHDRHQWWRLPVGETYGWDHLVQHLRAAWGLVRSSERGRAAGPPTPRWGPHPTRCQPATLSGYLRRMTERACLTPLGVVLRGAAAGAVGTVAMDLLWFSRYRRNGGDSGFVQWAFLTGLSSWDDAPAPAQFGRRLIRGVLQRELPPERARLVNNLVHWATGVGWGAAVGLVSGSLPTRRGWHGLMVGAGVWVQSYVVLVPAKIYKPVWEYDAETLWKDLSAHLVYGLATATTFRVLASPRRPAAVLHQLVHRLA